MKNLAALFISCFFFSQSYAQESANFGAPKFTPENGKKLLIVGQDLGSVGGLNIYTNGYVDNITCHIPAGVTSYTSINSLSGLTTLANWGAGDVHAQAYVNDPTFDHSVIVFGLYMVGIMDEINNGSKDNTIRNFANWIKGQNRPVFIRIGYEFEGSWNNYAPTAFKNAWQHIVHIFDEENVRNAAYVWQSAGLNYSNISSWYPGDDYVNWVGYSQFDGQNMGQSIKNFAVQHDKPIMIAEAAPKVDLSDGNGQSHWNNWYALLFNEIYNNDRIKALAYINADWDSQPMWTGQGWGDSRVQIDAVVKENWETEIKKTPWIHADENLFDILNYEDWMATNATEHQLSKQEKLLVSNDQNQILVQRENNQLMEGLSIWDLNGRLLHRDSTEQSRYEVSLSELLIQHVIITVQIENHLHSESIILKK